MNLNLEFNFVALTIEEYLDLYTRIRYLLPVAPLSWSNGMTKNRQDSAKASPTDDL